MEIAVNPQLATGGSLLFKWLNPKPLRSGAEVEKAITIRIPRARDDDRSRKKSIAKGGQGTAHTTFAMFFSLWH